MNIFRFVTLSVGAVAIVVVAGCASSGTKSSWFGGNSFQLPAYEEKRLANGLQVLFVPDNSLPYVSLSLMVRTGAAYDAPEVSGLASMVSGLLDKGTTRRSAPQIAADLGQMGADFDTSVGSEYTLISSSALSTKADLLLKNVYEIITEPTFSDAEVERFRKQVLARVSRLEDNPGAFADQAFQQFLFGSHPYANSVLGRLKSVSNIRKKHIIQHYLRYFRPNNSMLAVVGKYTPEFMAQVEKEFGAWQAREVPAIDLGKPAAPVGRQVLLVDKPGLVQAQIRLGHIGIERKSKDFIAVRVANTILGGAFASRLNSRIRKDLGLTYSIYSSFDAAQEPGSFEISTFTKNESIGQTVDEVLKLLTEFKKDGVTKEEVEATKGFLSGLFPQAIETPEKLAFNLLQLRLYGVPDTYLTQYLNDLGRLDAGDINGVIKKHFDPENIKILVYTSASAARSQLKAISGNVVEKKSNQFQ